jgi:two-component system cell cycle response regulator PopA
LVIEERSCSETSRLWDAIRDEGYELVTMPLGRTIEQAAVAQRPDVVLLNMIAAEMGSERNRYLDAVSRLSVAAGARRMPVIGVGDIGEGGRPLGMADVLPRPLSAGRLIGRIASLSRLATMQAELRRRMETGDRFGIDVPNLETAFVDRDANILVVGNGGRYLSFEASLSRMATLTGAFTATTARDYMARRSFDLVLLDMPLSDAIELTSEIRRNVAYFTLPIVGFGDMGDLDHIDSAHRAGLTDLMVGAYEPRDLMDRVRSAISENRLREQLKSIYTQARHYASNDALTGLFARGYLMEHLQRMVREARRAGERFAIIGLRVAQLADINKKLGYASGDHLLRQVGMTIARLVRGEDLAARAGGGRFAILLPSAGYEEAARASERIAGVIRSTRFAIPGGDEPYAVDLEIGHAVWTPSDDAESVLKRALGPQVR